MAAYEFYGYSTRALAFDAGTNSYMLDASYNAFKDRIRIDVTDDDAFFDGDDTNDEIGADANQMGIVSETNGDEIASGPIYVDQFAIIQAPDGAQITLYSIEINGQLLGYVPSAPLQPGTQYAAIGGGDVGENAEGQDTRQPYDYYEQNNVACFGPGTMVTTDQGEIPVEWLDTSDKVLTRDHGFQPILWIGRTKIAPEYFHKFPEERPVCIPAGTLGPNCPTHDLQLTGDHRIMLQSAAAELMFFSSEVLAPAKSWVDVGIAATVNPSKNYLVTHILCASHQVIVAQGAWVESMFTGTETLRRLDQKDIKRLEHLLGSELYTQQTARPCLTRKEARLLLRLGQEMQHGQFLKSA